MPLGRWALGAALSGLLAVSGCQSSRRAEARSLKIWLAADYAGKPVFKAVTAEFERQHPEIKVKMLGVPWEDMPTKVKTAIIGGNPPDLAHEHPFALGAQGFAEKLDDLWEHWGKAGEFLPGALEDVTWRGHKYGMPLDINCTVLVYNRALFGAAGLHEPDEGYDFGRMRRDLERLKASHPGRYGIGLSTGAWHTFAFVRANGGDVLVEDRHGMRATFTDPRTVEAVRFLTELGHKYHLGPTPTTKARDYDDATTLFSVGKVGVIYTGPWDFANIAKNAPGLDFGVVSFPAGLDGRKRGSVQGGGGLFVPKGARHRKLAFEWMQLATRRDFALRLAKEEGRFPVKVAHYDDPYFRQDPRVRTFVAALPAARPFKLVAYPQAHQAFGDAVKAAFYGADPAIELARAQRVAQLAIEAVEGQ